MRRPHRSRRIDRAWIGAALGRISYTAYYGTITYSSYYIVRHQLYSRHQRAPVRPTSGHEGPAPLRKTRIHLQTRAWLRW
eukprot:COSAG01_NODE_3181_length_6453_cov_7.178155_1_plen_80_part_00